MHPDEASLVAEAEGRIFTDPWKREDLEELALSNMHTILVCTDGSGDVLGYLIGSHVAGESEILRVATDKRYRRCGAASALMKRFFSDRESLGDEVAFLEVRASNAPAISLYRAFGFEEYGIRRGYYKDPTEDALLMRLTLPPKT